MTSGTPKPSRRLVTLAAGSVLALMVSGAMASTAAPGGSQGKDVGTDASTTTGRDASSAIVRLSGDPLSLRTGGNSLDLASASMRSDRAALAAQRAALRDWLKTNAPKAKISGEYDIAVNAVAVRLNGTSLSTLRSAPGVVSADYQALYTPLAHEDPDLALIDAQAGWTASGLGDRAGTGIQVGIVDTGIDVTHPCFSDAGFPETTKLGDTRFTNNKVIVAKVFNNKAAQQGLTAAPEQDHGTHVAGTVACNAHTPATVQGADIPYDPSGVAPRAQLGSYNVFPGQVDNARSEDILNALQAAAADGMDVINMSLGGGASGVQDLLTAAVDNLDRANIVVAVASGNSGPGHFTVESPGSAERALTAGASTVGHFVGLPVTSGGTTLALAATGDFATPETDLTAPLAQAGGATLGTGCTAAEFGDMTDQIALVSRGTCTFGTKVFNAEKAGAVAAIIVNNVPGDPIAMGADALFTTTIPAVMVGLDARDELTAAVGHEVTIGSQAAYVNTANDNIMAAFSSQGPTDVDLRVKPDVVAPGVNVLSSIPAAFCTDSSAGCWAFFQGTSMATPHLAGMAAVVRQAHPDWQAWQVRSAVVNTAQQGVLTRSADIGQLETDVQVVGAGLADLGAAVGAQVALAPVSTSFGAVSSGSGQTLTRQVAVTNVSGVPQSLGVSVTGSKSFTVSPASITVAPGATQTVTVTFSAGKRAAPGNQQATLQLGGVAHAVLFASIQ